MSPQVPCKSQSQYLFSLLVFIGCNSDSNSGLVWAVVMFDSFMDDAAYVRDVEVCVLSMICYIPRCICYGSKNYGLGFLHDDSVGLAGATPQFYSVASYRFDYRSGTKLIYKMQLHDVLIGLWGAVSAAKIIWLFVTRDRKFTTIYSHILTPCLNTCQITREPMPIVSQTVCQLTPKTDGRFEICALLGWDR